MNWAVKAANGFLDRSAAGLKAFTMTFGKQTGFYLLPRTRYNYRMDVGQGLGSTIVVATIGWTMRNFAQVPFRIRKRRQEKGKTVLEDVEPSQTGPGAMLRLLEYPNSSYSGRLMMKALVIDYETTGESYLVKLRNGSGRVVELWWIPQMLIRPRWPEDGSVYISHYEYNPNGVPFGIKVDDIVHLRDGLDPRNPRQGFNRLAALAREIYTDEEASNFSATLLSNLGVPGVIISPKDTGVASRNRIEDPEGVKDSYMEKFSGDRRGEPLILTSPTEVQILSFSPEQMGLVNLRRLPEERVSAVLGVPAIVAGLGAGLERSTYSNMAEAREAAYEEKILPMHGDWSQDLKVQLLNEFVGDITQYEIDADLGNIRVLQEDQDALQARNLAALLGGGISRRLYKENIGEEADDNDNVYYIPTNVSVVNADEPPPALEADLQLEEPPNLGVLQAPPTPLLEAGPSKAEVAVEAVASKLRETSAGQDREFKLLRGEVADLTRLQRESKSVEPPKVVIEAGAIAVTLQQAAAPEPRSTTRTVERDDKGRIVALKEYPDGE